MTKRRPKRLNFELLKKILARGRQDPEFFHRLVFDFDSVASEYAEELDNVTLQALKGFQDVTNLWSWIEVQVSPPFGVGSGYGCSGSGPGGEGSCKKTCVGSCRGWSCGRSCKITCGKKSCSLTKNNVYQQSPGYTLTEDWWNEWIDYLPDDYWMQEFYEMPELLIRFIVDNYPRPQ